MDKIKAAKGEASEDDLRKLSKEVKIHVFKTTLKFSVYKNLFRLTP